MITRRFYSYLFAISIQTFSWFSDVHIYPLVTFIYTQLYVIYYTVVLFVYVLLL